MKTRRILIAALIAGIMTAILSNVPYINFINLVCCGLVWLGAGFSVLYLNYLKGDDRNTELSVQELEEEIEKLKEADASLAPEIQSSVLQKMFQFNVSRQEGMLTGGLTGIFASLTSGVFYFVQLTNMGFEQVEAVMSDINLPYDPAVFGEVVELFGTEANAIFYFAIFYTLFMLVAYALIGVLSGFLSVELFSKLKVFRAKP